MESPPPPGYAAYPRADQGMQGSFGPPPHRVRIESVIDAWNLVRKDFGSWIAGIIVIGLVAMLCSLPSTFARMNATLGQGLAGPNYGLMLPTYLVSGVVTSVLMAGLMRMGLMKVRGQYASVGEMFKLEGMFWQLALYGVVCSLVQSVVPQIVVASVVAPATTTGSGQYSSLLYSGAIVGLFAAFFGTLFVLTPLIIIDQKKPAFEAMGISAKTLAPFLLITFATIALAGIFSGLGVFACCVGILFTAPVSVATPAIIYHDFFRPAPVEPAAYVPPAGPEFSA